ncbi:MAG: pyridoxamine 5'-phosphate oxidase family protein [Anaerolineaceae bacterium]|nr:pyridoxamine 5'-phosphate oxidase family protein [Anaerolineaceae bacterium]
MTALPQEVSQAWEQREGPVVLATVDAQGNPNAIYVTCVSRYGRDRLVVADNYFDKTRANILAGSKASVLFITKERKSYQIKGTIAFHTQGEVYDDMKRWNPPQHPGRAAAVLQVEQVFCGAKDLTPAA